MPEVAAAPAERALPHNLEAERSVLGAVLIHNEAFNFAVEIIAPGDFFRDAHRRIFEKMVRLSDRGDAIDLVTLKEELGRSGELDEVGGVTERSHGREVDPVAEPAPPGGGRSLAGHPGSLAEGAPTATWRFMRPLRGRRARRPPAALAGPAG